MLGCSMIVMALEFRISSLRTIKRQVGGSGGNAASGNTGSDARSRPVSSEAALPDRRRIRLALISTTRNPVADSIKKLSGSGGEARKVLPVAQGERHLQAAAGEESPRCERFSVRCGRKDNRRPLLEMRPDWLRRRQLQASAGAWMSGGCHSTPARWPGA
jgi:hypothetical protein